MITDDAYNKLQMEVHAQKLGDGELAESLRLYFHDYRSIELANPKWSKKQIEESLLRPTGVESLVNIARKNYKEGAIKVTKTHRLLSNITSAAISVFLSIVANLLFTFIMIVFFLSAKDISADVFRSLGFQVTPPAIEANHVGGPH